MFRVRIHCDGSVCSDAASEFPVDLILCTLVSLWCTICMWRCQWHFLSSVSILLCMCVASHLSTNTRINYLLSLFSLLSSICLGRSNERQCNSASAIAFIYYDLTACKFEVNSLEHTEHNINIGHIDIDEYLTLGAIARNRWWQKTVHRWMCCIGGA